MCGSNGALRLDLHEPLLRERVGERPVDEAHAVLELRLLVLGRGLERALEVVDHRQQLLDEPLGGARDQARLVARRALAVVVELGLEALQRVEVLVALRASPPRARSTRRLCRVAHCSSAASAATSFVASGARRARRSRGLRLSSSTTS